MDLPDLNLWLALAWSGHRHHAIACRYWEEQAADTVVLTTVTALGLMRLLSRGTWPARLCTDVHHTALAIAADCRLVSFDRDFGRFKGLSWLPLAGE